MVRSDTNLTRRWAGTYGCKNGEQRTVSSIWADMGDDVKGPKTAKMAVYTDTLSSATRTLHSMLHGGSA